MGLGYPTSDFEMQEIALHDGWYDTFMFLKILRLVKSGDIRNELKRILDYILEYFPHKGMFLTQLLDLIMTGIRFVCSIHFSTCGWIMLTATPHESIDRS